MLTWLLSCSHAKLILDGLKFKATDQAAIFEWLGNQWLNTIHTICTVYTRFLFSTFDDKVKDRYCCSSSFSYFDQLWFIVLLSQLILHFHTAGQRTHTCLLSCDLKTSWRLPEVVESSWKRNFPTRNCSCCSSRIPRLSKYLNIPIKMYPTMVMCDKTFHFSAKRNPGTLMTYLQACKVMTDIGWSQPDVAVQNCNSGKQGFLEVSILRLSGATEPRQTANKAKWDLGILRGTRYGK